MENNVNPSSKSMAVGGSLMSLPPEVREMIFEYALYMHSSKGVVYCDRFNSRARLIGNLNLILTCRQIFNEAAGTFYSVNHFHLPSIRRGFGFLDRLTHVRRLAGIESLTVDMCMFWPAQITKQFEQLRRLPRLKALRLVLLNPTAALSKIYYSIFSVIESIHTGILELMHLEHVELKFDPPEIAVNDRRPISWWKVRQVVSGFEIMLENALVARKKSTNATTAPQEEN